MAGIVRGMLTTGSVMLVTILGMGKVGGFLNSLFLLVLNTRAWG
ncbi:MAG: hypothetical protein RBJ76_03900 [Stenomitos frigidus ULC029]